MTAEIAVMNQEAVALAADSAVTGRAKIFTSANKIFALSKYHPVALMVFDNAQFLSVPWDTIVKQYRRQLGDKSFPTLQEHAEDFLDFFERSPTLFPPEAESQAAGALAYSIFETILTEALEWIEDRIGAGEEPTQQDVTKDIEVFIEQHRNDWKRAKRRSGLPKNYRETVTKRYRKQVDAAIRAVFERVGLSSKALKQLRGFLAEVAVKDRQFEEASTHSGIVIAGFGSKDVFPRLRRYHFEGILAKHLKVTEDIPISVGIRPAERAYIVPFAQREQVETFMEGIDPDLRNYLHGWWHQKLDGLVEEVADELKLPKQKRTKLVEAFEERCGEIVHREFEEDLIEYAHQNNVRPVINIVGMLPKDVLAEMAESLVNLTSFKRRVTPQAETVGGPIDVAVISRGDGFIWIKRKHYFEPALNPHFLAHYYPERHGKSEGKKKDR